jgi:hypothetical protein
MGITLEKATNFILKQCGYDFCTLIRENEKEMLFLATQNGDEFDVKVIHETGEVKYTSIDVPTDFWVTEGWIKK